MKKRTWLSCAFLLFVFSPTASSTQEAKPSAPPLRVYWQLFTGCDSGESCTRKETFQVGPLPRGNCALTVRNGDGFGTDETRSYEVFLNGERVIPVHRSGNARVDVKVLGKNTLKVVLVGESFRRVSVEVLCDAQADRAAN